LVQTVGDDVDILDLVYVFRNKNPTTNTFQKSYLNIPTSIQHKNYRIHSHGSWIHTVRVIGYLKGHVAVLLKHGIITVCVFTEPSTLHMEMKFYLAIRQQ
jgi:hypothetical protein